jgi:hypothetical protein
VQTAEFLGSAHTLDVAYVRVTASRRDVTEMDSHPPAPWDYDTTVGTTP